MSRRTRATVIGLGREGVAVVRYLCALGVSVTVSDAKRTSQLAESLRQIEGLPVRLSLGENRVEDVVDADVIYISPGVPLNLPCITAARGKGVPQSSLTRLFFDRCRAPIIGITGSSGKTTTTSLVGAIFKEAGRHTFVGGNIGVTLLERLDEITPDSWVVLEMSSFQLELMDESPRVAAITNVTPNHLDIHPSMEAYIGAKENILNFQAKDDIAVLNFDDPITRDLARKCRGKIIFFSRTKEPQGDAAFTSEAKVMLRFGGAAEAVCDTSDVKLLGKHNLENVLCACAIARACGITTEAMRNAIVSFKGVEHRLEHVGTIDGVDYYNDSIATTPERAVAGLKCFERPVVLMAGGRDKHLPLAPLAEAIRRHCRAVVLFGEAAALLEEGIAPQAKSVEIARAESFVEALEKARELARSGDVVLLSPACTSFDMFKDFEERGRSFKRLVRQVEMSEARS